MRIAMFGSGAIGLLHGALLQRSGAEVVYIARGRTLEVLRDHGVRVIGKSGDFQTPEVQATDDTASLEPADAVIVGVKAWQTRDAAKQMRPLLRPDTCVLPMQNGIEAPMVLDEILGADHTLGGVSRVICKLEEPGVVNHVGFGPMVWLGEMNNARSERTQRLANALSAAGIETLIPDDIHREMWHKFLFITTISGIGAVTRAPLGVTRSLPESRELMSQLMTEIAALAKAAGSDLGDDIVERSLAFLDTLQHDATASMQRDIEEGRPSELDDQNGAAVRLGENLGVPTPAHAFVVASLLPQERAARGQ